MTAILRTACICGETAALPFGKKDGVSIVRCTCGVARVGRLDIQRYTAQYMTGFYHDEHIATVVGETINNRTEHDSTVALDRITRLKEWRLGGTLLDVGCGNGAFVREAVEAGYDAYGCDLYIPEAGQDLGDRLRCAELKDAGFGRRTIDVLMMNDVIEHLPEPVAFLRQAKGIVKRDGIIVIDTPDFEPMFAGTAEAGLEYRHVKPKEHLFYATPDSWLTLFAVEGFEIVFIDKPIEGKIVFYIRPDPNEVIDVKVYGPTGVGDIHWVLLKMPGLKAAEAPCKLTLIIPGHGDAAMIFRAKEYFELLPWLDGARMEIGPPVMMDYGADDPAIANYILIANGHLERGQRIENWHDEWPVDYRYPVIVPDEARQFARQIKENVGKLVVFYCSSKAWNYEVSGKAWTIDDWNELTQMLNVHGITPVLIGKHWDNDYSAEFRSRNCRLCDLTGKTTIAQVMALYEIADAVVGMCSGITILAAHARVPAIVFWPEKGKTGARFEMHRDFQTNWVDHELLEKRQYVPLSLGTFTSGDILEQLREWSVL